ncbi:biotin/lipoate A/B protein ligase family protein [Bordetella pertussis H934]|nr:biotin/lipoate A/B protein ligase family protein [Bordetella pertussis H934]
MHGEYKVPGGKLVVIDLEVAQGRLRQVRLSGDFFLEPPEALEAINRGLDGLPADAGAEGIAQAVRAALPAEAELFGFSPEAVAVGRAEGAVMNRTAWTDYDWQLIHPGPLPPALHMALDAAITDEVGAGQRPPTLRIWEWSQPAVIIGRFQSLRNEVDPDGARRHGVTVVRRVSGGGAMFVEPGNTITYSLSVPQALVAGMSFQESYAFLDAWVIRALHELGIKAWYQPLNDIASDAGKIGGAAQARRAGAVLHHVTMSYDIDADKMVEVLRIGREKLSDKGTTSARKRVDPLRSQTGLARDTIIERMLQTFAGMCRLTPAEIGAATLQAAQRQAEEKFSSPEWTALVP